MNFQLSNINFQLNKVYHGDCLDIMPKIPQGSVDFILCDVPFGITSNYWDKKIPFEPMWQNILRVIKPNAAIALFANGKFVFELGNSNLKMYRYKWCVEKDLGAGFLNAKKMPLKCHEDILIFYNKLPTYNPQFFYSTPYFKKKYKCSSTNYRELNYKKNRSSDGQRYPRDVIKFDYPMTQTKPVLHPTQKPVELLRYMIRTYTNENELVLDFCCGSGSTCVAALLEHRNFIGIELDEKYFEIAGKRIENEQRKIDNELSIFNYQL